jgi:hypothetical protein
VKGHVPSPRKKRYSELTLSIPASLVAALVNPRFLISPATDLTSNSNIFAEADNDDEVVEAFWWVEEFGLTVGRADEVSETSDRRPGALRAEVGIRLSMVRSRRLAGVSVWFVFGIDEVEV